MTKRLQPLLVVAMVLLVPALVFAGSSKLTMTKVSAEKGKVVVSVVASNAHQLAGIDLPLQYSEGATLEKVTFEGTRVEYFDFKSAYINHDERTVVIGLLPQFGPENKPDLAAGEGAICEMHFRVDDESVSKLSIEAIEMKDPNHSATFITSENGRVAGHSPEFSTVSFNLNDAVTPGRFGLCQNYPNPFNPTTVIAFDVAKAGHVNLTIFNVLGQKVCNLVNGHKDAGSYQVEWDASRNSSGVYFYRLQQGDQSLTRKMSLLK